MNVIGTVLFGLKTFEISVHDCGNTGAMVWEIAIGHKAYWFTFRRSQKQLGPTIPGAWYPFISYKPWAYILEFFFKT